MFSVAPFSGLAEFRPGFSPRPQISHVVFDFDGTLTVPDTLDFAAAQLFEVESPAERQAPKVQFT